MAVMNESTKIQDAFALLHIDEYLKRLNVGRTRVFEWKRGGTLIPDRNYVQIAKNRDNFHTRGLLLVSMLN